MKALLAAARRLLVKPQGKSINDPDIQFTGDQLRALTVPRHLADCKAYWRARAALNPPAPRPIPERKARQATSGSVPDWWLIS